MAVPFVPTATTRLASVKLVLAKLRVTPSTVTLLVWLPALASVALPNATEPSKPDLACAPKMVMFVPFAKESEPILMLFSFAAVAFTPKASELSPDALALPIAIVPFAVAWLLPSAIAPTPLLVALPMAIPPSWSTAPPEAANPLLAVLVIAKFTLGVLAVTVDEPAPTLESPNATELSPYALPLPNATELLPLTELPPNEIALLPCAADQPNAIAPSPPLAFARPPPIATAEEP